MIGARGGIADEAWPQRPFGARRLPRSVSSEWRRLAFDSLLRTARRKLVPGGGIEPHGLAASGF